MYSAKHIDKAIKLITVSGVFLYASSTIIFPLLVSIWAKMPSLDMANESEEKSKDRIIKSDLIITLKNKMINDTQNH